MGDTKILTLELPLRLAQDMYADSRALMVEVMRRGMRDLRIEQALERYRQGISNLGTAAEYAGLSRSEFATLRVEGSGPRGRICRKTWRNT